MKWQLKWARLAGLAWLLCTALVGWAFDLQGHRGARGLAPENTLAGFRAAMRVGVSTLELDLGMTRDGLLVVTHDPRLNPNLTRDAQGRWAEAPGTPVFELTLAELQRHDVGRIRPGTRYATLFAGQEAVDGERIPTLDALLHQVREVGPPTLQLNIEVKTNPTEPALTATPAAFASALVELLGRHDLLGRSTVQSFDWRVLREVQRLAPALPTAALSSRQDWLDNVGDPRWTAGLTLAGQEGSVPRLVQAVGARTWSPFHGDLNEATLREAQALGLKVLPWTVNEPAAIERLVALGVDGLISDYPDRVRAVLARRALPLPARAP